MGGVGSDERSPRPVFNCSLATVPAVLREPGKADQTYVARAGAALVEHGFVLLEQVFEPLLLEGLLAEIQDRYMPQSSHFIDNITVAGAFDSLELYANPFVLSVMTAVLGPGFLLNTVGCALSPTGQSQRTADQDQRFLYATDAALVASLPAYALSVFVPLAAGKGTTNIAVASHRDSAEAPGDVVGHAVAAPEPTLGSCYILDYRTIYQDREVQRDRPLPVLVMTYSRRWFRAAKAAGRGQTLSIELATLEAWPPYYRPLLATTAASGQLLLRDRASRRNQKYGTD